ncbi:hypothetical protein C0J52_10894, partial [Blattella germanica]
LLSLYLTYYLGFHASRLRSSDGVLGVSRQDNMVYSDGHTNSPFRSQQLLDLLFKLEQKQTWRDRFANWTLLLCLAYSDGDPDCLTRQDFHVMLPLQRVNRILGVHSVLWKHSGLCKTATQLAELPALSSRPLTPLCFTLPEQFEEFLNVADGAGFNSSWLLKPTVGEGKMEHLSTMQFFNMVRLKEFPESQERLVQQFLPNQLQILGFPVSIQLFVLVTSVAPLRAYLYREGFVYFRQGEENSYKKIPGKWWLLSQLWRHVAVTQGTSAVKMALDNTDMLLVHLLLGAEAFLLVQIANLPITRDTGCENCFQLLAVELMYNSSFYPVVLGVSGHPIFGTESLNNTPPSGVHHNLRQALLSDTLSLLFATDSVHRSVFDALQIASAVYNTGVTGIQCLISHELCLTEDDLASLLASRREMLNTGKFRRLYPTASGTRYSKYLQELQALMLQDSKNIFQPANSLFRETLWHSTSDLHGIQTRLEQMYTSQSGSVESLEVFSDPDPEPEVADEYSFSNETRILHSLNLQSIESKPSEPRTNNCSLGKLFKIYTCNIFYKNNFNEICDMATKGNNKLKLNYCITGGYFLPLFLLTPVGF